MPTRPPRVCPRCQTANVGDCDCKPRRGTRSQSSKVTGTRRWGKARRDQLRREPICQHADTRCPECHGQCEQIAEQVDHIVPIADGGATFDPSNHQSLCVPCHDVKSRAERHARASARR